MRSQLRPHWDAKAGTWDAHLPRSDLFAELLDTVLGAARPGPGDVALDLGAGSGFLTIPIAARAARTYALDHSQEMLRLLGDRVAAEGRTLFAKRGDLAGFAPPPERVDVVVSNYALHHLSHEGKRRLLRDAHDFMAPGGRFVVSDLMVPLTLRPGESGPLIRKVASIARKGPAGWWRIAKNLVRWGTGRGEYPASLEFWQGALHAAGFVDVGGRHVGEESGVAWGTKPAVAG